MPRTTVALPAPGSYVGPKVRPPQAFAVGGWIEDIHRPEECRNSKVGLLPPHAPKGKEALSLTIGAGATALNVALQAAHPCGIRSYSLEITLTEEGGEREQWRLFMPIEADLPPNSGNAVSVSWHWGPLGKRHNPKHWGTLPVADLKGVDIHVSATVISRCGTRAEFVKRRHVKA